MDHTSTRRMRLIAGALLSISTLLCGCGKGWKLDYDDPAAQFSHADVASKGRSFIGKKITVKGTVAKIDISDPTSAWIHLTGGIKCNLGKFKVMAESEPVGATVYVDGFLKRCQKGDVLLEPAILRDPTAPFSPQ